MDRRVKPGDDESFSSTAFPGDPPCLIRPDFALNPM